MHAERLSIIAPKGAPYPQFRRPLSPAPLFGFGVLQLCPLELHK
ncbi:hypothetical protein LU11_gp130 [Pseudomonas phage Lu11]|nr:hypothetical protein LU11_gp130 [Pseudomonas phage Lu11]AFH14661.1 hypothetical protein Lu11_0129B [Pseudomonas phage Lu11]